MQKTYEIIIPNNIYNNVLYSEKQRKKEGYESKIII